MLSGECSLGVHGLLRFRTNDVLLGTSGVGVRMWCLIPPGFFVFIYLIFGYIGFRAYPSRQPLPMTKNEERPCDKREDAISNTERDTQRNRAGLGVNKNI